ncbi:MAG: CDP-alcohol phosphatidyltransferase family protein [bacterium]|jgi:CDP-diacylglycerol--glycerol-3-phosphate 3-phosphatidyltransferase
MTLTGAIGTGCNSIIVLIVRALALSRIHPNMLTFFGLLINGFGAFLLARGKFFSAGLVIVGAALFDMVDGRVARETKQVTAFGAFFDSVIDRYSDLVLLMGLLIYYASIDRFFYIILTAVVMLGSVMVSYTRARAESLIPTCKVGFMERPERTVLLIIGALFGRMAPVLWVLAVLSNITVAHRMLFTWQATRQIDQPELAGVNPADQSTRRR